MTGAKKPYSTTSPGDWEAEFSLYFVQALQIGGRLLEGLNRRHDELQDAYDKGRRGASFPLGGPPGPVPSLSTLRRHIKVIKTVLTVGPHKLSAHLYGVDADIPFDVVDDVSLLLPRWAQKNEQYRPAIMAAGAADPFWTAVDSLPPIAGSSEAIETELAMRLEVLDGRPGVVISDQATLYRMIATTIRRPQPDPKNRCLVIGSLHGHLGRRTAVEPDETSPLGVAFAEFATAVNDRIQSSEEPWAVRQLINVVNLDRLEQIEGRQLSMGGENNQIRAFVAPSALPVLSPLIIANQYAFLALDDNRLFRASTALFEHGDETIEWIQNYFDVMWQEAPYRLRDRVGNNEDDLRELRAELQRLGSVSDEGKILAQKGRMQTR